MSVEKHLLKPGLICPYCSAIHERAVSLGQVAGGDVPDHAMPYICLDCFELSAISATDGIVTLARIDSLAELDLADSDLQRIEVEIEALCQFKLLIDFARRLGTTDEDMRQLVERIKGGFDDEVV